MSKIEDTILDLINARDYDLCEHTDEVICAVKPDGNNFIVLLPPLNQFNVQNLLRCTNRMTQLDTQHALVIYTDRASSQALKATERMRQGMKSSESQQNTDLSPIRIELFLEDDLKHNIMTHILQPKFEKLDEEEAKIIKNKWPKMAIMKISDPVAKFMGYQKGDVIRITRKYDFIIYRIVK